MKKIVALLRFPLDTVAVLRYVQVINNEPVSVRMATNKITSIDFAPNAFDTFLENVEDVPMVKTDVIVTDGIAAVPPTYHDFKEWEKLNNDDWLMLRHMAETAQRVLASLDECNPPDLDARWTLCEALRRIREGADALEKHIADNGLWLSKLEKFECESDARPLLWPEDPRKKFQTVK